MRYLYAMLLAVALAASAQRGLAADMSADSPDLKTLRTAARGDKRAFVASTLKLTDAEAKRFWPLYDAYQRALDLTNRRRTVAFEGILNDHVRSDLYARTFANEVLSSDEIEIKARRTLYNRTMKALPPKKAARYIQLEDKIRAIQAYDAAEVIPLLE
jgi:Spy/CpxP family protein refolding chaperone